MRRALPFLALVMLVLVVPARAQHYLAGPDSLHPRLKFADSLVSLNHRCMVSGSKLNPKVRPIYINGVPVGFC